MCQLIDFQEDFQLLRGGEESAKKWGGGVRRGCGEGEGGRDGGGKGRGVERSHEAWGERRRMHK